MSAIMSAKTARASSRGMSLRLSKKHPVACSLIVFSVISSPSSSRHSLALSQALSSTCSSLENGRCEKVFSSVSNAFIVLNKCGRSCQCGYCREVRTKLPFQSLRCRKSCEKVFAHLLRVSLWFSQQVLCLSCKCYPL